MLPSSGEVCSSGKKCFLTRHGAKHTAKKIKRAGAGHRWGDKVILRPYPCRECGFYHLTSRVNQADRR